MYNQNEKAVFIKAEIRESQSGNLYVWTKSFDLSKVIRELETSFVTVTLIKPRNAKSETERLLIFKPGNSRFTSKNNNGNAKHQNNNNGSSSKADNSLI